MMLYTTSHIIVVFWYMCRSCDSSKSFIHVGLCALSIYPTTTWWRMRGHKYFIAFDRRPSPLLLEWIVKSLTIPPSQCGSNDSNLWSGFDTTCRTVCLTDPSNDQLVKDEGAQIFYSIRSQNKPIGIGANCEIPYNTHFCQCLIGSQSLLYNS